MATDTLAGIKVLDLTSYLAGPFASTLMGDLGADVIKIESPGGDMMRYYPSTLNKGSRAYVGANRNKRSIIIDLKNPLGLGAFLRLVSEADIVMHNFRPGVAERLSIDFTALTATKPDLVYCSLTGFGQSGPYVERPGFDQVLQSMTGIAWLQGGDAGPQVVWGSIVDYYAAALVALGLSAALRKRDQTGQPQEIDASLLRSALALQSGRMVWAADEPKHIERDLRGGKLAGIHPTKEGYLYLQAQTPAFWVSLCELLGVPELAENPKYDTMVKRKHHEEEILPVLRAALAKRTAVEWQACFGDRVPCTVVQPMEDMFENPQVLAQGLIVEHSSSFIGPYKTVTEPIRMNGGRSNVPDRCAPALGEHTEEVLSEFGFSQEEIEHLMSQRAVRSEESRA